LVLVTKPYLNVTDLLAQKAYPIVIPSHRALRPSVKYCTHHGSLISHQLLVCLYELLPRMTRVSIKNASVSSAISSNGYLLESVTCSLYQGVKTSATRNARQQSGCAARCAMRWLQSMGIVHSTRQAPVAPPLRADIENSVALRRFVSGIKGALKGRH
jgi:hypothetical protein